MRSVVHSFLLALTFAACATTPLPPVPPPQPATATCADVCANMAKLDCPSAKPTARGATCERVCQNFQDSGIATWDLPCRSVALSCATADLCESRK